MLRHYVDVSSSCWTSLLKQVDLSLVSTWFRFSGASDAGGGHETPFLRFLLSSC